MDDLAGQLFFRGTKVKKLLTILFSAVVGLVLSANVTAATYTDMGDLGDINAGPLTGLGTAIFTQDLYTGSVGSSWEYHSYTFSASQPSEIAALFEFGTDMQQVNIAIFEVGDTNPITLPQDVFTADAFFNYYFSVAPGDYLIQIDALGDGGDNASYKVQLFATPVPLPPAALLFISALAGFGVIGRRKGSKA